MQSGMVFIGIIAPLLAGFAVSAVSGRYLIPFLRRVKAGQTERTDGPQSHLSKTGTPNMGGIMILLGLAAACIIACFLPGTGSSEVIPVLILSIGFGLVGFIDDYLKVVKKKSDGLSAKQKMALQIVIALLFALYITKINAIPLTMKVPFAPGVYLDLKFFNIPAFLFISVEVFVICASIEAEIAELDDDERAMFLEDLGVTEAGLDKLISASYRTLGLMSFLTAGEDETRAWTIKIGTKAPQAAGKIHSDFERGFIKAEVVNYKVLLELGSLSAAREKGLVGIEGKDYVVKDGDVILFRFNV